MTRSLLAALLAVLLIPAAAHAATPQRAARITRACLADHGWSARLADHGTTVDARAPRARAGYPSRPWFSIAFYDAGDGATGSNEIRLALNRSENATASSCKRRGLRAT